MPPDQSPTADMLPLRAVAGLGLQLGFAVSAVAVVCVYGGHALDEHFATAPYGIIAGIALGLAASIGIVWVITREVRARATDRTSTSAK